MKLHQTNNLILTLLFFFIESARDALVEIDVFSKSRLQKRLQTLSVRSTNLNLGVVVVVFDVVFVELCQVNDCIQHLV